MKQTSIGTAIGQVGSADPVVEWQGKPHPWTGGLDYSTLRTEYLIVTPQMAREWLERNTFNRPVTPGHVATMVRDILAGRWVLTHQGISFAKSGRLMDGQHRLLAVLRAAEKTPAVHIPLAVSFGLEEAVFKQIDTGARLRPDSTVLGLANTWPRPYDRVRAIAYIMRILESAGQTSKMSTSELEIQVQRNIDAIRWVITQIPNGRGVGASQYAGAIAFAYQACPKETESFVMKLMNKAPSQEGDPATALVTFVAQNPNSGTGGGGRYVLAVKALAALLAHVRGKQLTTLRLSKEAREFFLVRRQRRSEGK